MNDNKFLYEISIYIKGDDLRPDDLTKIIGVNPTKSHEKGKLWTSPSGNQIIKPTEIWSLSMESRNISEFAKTAKAIGDKLSGIKGLLDTLPGIENAYIDILIIKATSDDGGGTCEFGFDKDALSALCDLGLPMQFTVQILLEKKINPHHDY